MNLKEYIQRNKADFDDQKMESPAAAVFEKRLRKVGFNVKGVPAKVHEGAKRAAYWLFVADLV